MVAVSSFDGIVKSVLSGDTVNVADFQSPSQEHTLSLAYVTAPRLRREGDEPFAFESRDFLRRLVVGRAVQCHVLYEIDSGTKREYGTVRPLAAQAPILPDAALAEGWLRVRDEAKTRTSDADAKEQVEKLESIEFAARQLQKGIWGPDGSKLDVTYELSDPRTFVSTWKGKNMPAIVERIIRGDRLLVRLMLSPTEHVQTILLLAGIIAPATKHTQSDGKEIEGEPCAEEARQFVEDRLLQRNVEVNIVGLSSNNALIGNVIHPKGSIATFLLQAGLARCADHHSTMLGFSKMGSLRQAERQAKENRLGIFASYAGPKTKTVDAVDVVVTRIQSADTIFVRTRSGDEKKISLSSIRQPKLADAKQAPYSDEAKEIVRKKLIGKHISITIDGKKPASEGYEEREVATVMLNNKNVALSLVESGYASVIRHRRDDEDRSPDYDALLAAEQAAQEGGKGMWSPKPPAAKHYQDYSENVQKAKMQASVLQRQRKIPAIVDYVKSGSRFAILVPRENAKLTFVLSGIRAPKSARNANDSSEPFGQEAHEFANRRCMQREVEVDVETTDKVGGFIGTLYVNRENFAKLLLEEGLAKVHDYSAQQSGNATEYYAAEKKAKEAHKGLWHDWDPSQDVISEDDEVMSVDENEPAPAPAKDMREIVVTYIDPTNAHLRVQTVGSGSSHLVEMMTSFRAFHLNKANDRPLSGPPKVGDLVAARFSEDNEWYRARVRHNDREKKISEIIYIDYGNSETMPWAKLRALTQAEFGTQALKPQAVEAELSFVQFPVNTPDYLKDAVYCLEGLTANRQFIANVDSTNRDGSLCLTIYRKGSSEGKLDASVNADIIAEGCAMVARKLKSWERAVDIGSIKAMEQEAKENRRGIWEYGDVYEDDE